MFIRDIPKVERYRKNRNKKKDKEKYGKYKNRDRTTVCGFKAYRNLRSVLLQKNIKYINSNYSEKRNRKNESVSS